MSTNGITVESLLVIARAKLLEQQNTKYSNAHNRNAIYGINIALGALKISKMLSKDE